MNCTKGAGDQWSRLFPELARIRDPAWLDAVQAARRQSVPRGTVVLRPRDPNRQVMLLLSGTLRVYLPGESGREIILYRIKAGEICLLSLPHLMCGPSDLAEAAAETDAILMQIPLVQFQNALQASSALNRYVYSMIGERLGDIMLLLQELAFQRLDVRLARVLLRDHQLRGTNVICKTHQDLAAELGSSREVISRLLKEFERSGWVRLDRGRIEVLSREQMEALP